MNSGAAASSPSAWRSSDTACVSALSVTFASGQRASSRASFVTRFPAWSRRWSRRSRSFGVRSSGRPSCRTRYATRSTTNGPKRQAAGVTTARFYRLWAWAWALGFREIHGRRGVYCSRRNQCTGEKTMKAVSRRLVMAVLVLSWGQTASAQTADEIIDKYLTAIGGRAALGKLTSRTKIGTMTSSTPAGDVSGPVEILNQQPNKSRMLIKMDLSSLGAGPMTVDQRFDGTSGYVLDSLQGNRGITGKKPENTRNGALHR